MPDDHATPEADTPPAATPESGASPTFRRARRHMRLVLDHLWGPTGSILLHILILFVLVRLVSFSVRDPSSEIEVMVVDPETVDLDEVLRELEDIPEVDIDVTPPDSDIMMEEPPDVPRDDHRPDDDLGALDIATDVQSPLVMRGLFSGRTAEGRAAMARRHAGRHAAATQAAALRALEWLKARQLEDGSWQGDGTASSKTGMTGLGLLTFLAHGETTTSERFGPTVERALRFLTEQAMRSNGTFRFVETAASRGGVYSHGIAAYALSEAYALTRIPSVKEAMELTVAHIVRGQREDGGFDYQFALHGGQRDRCTSVAAWMVQAMKAAYIAGAEIEGLEAAMERAVNGMRLMFDGDSGHFVYAANTGVVRHSMTGPGVLSLQLLGQANSDEVRRGLAAISGWRPDWESPPTGGGILEPLYVWYYVTQAFFHSGGQTWNRWNDAFASMLVDAQNEDGSWTWSQGRSAAYGPVYATTFSALSLMVYYRYLPTYQPIATQPIATHEQDDDVQVEIR